MSETKLREVFEATRGRYRKLYARLEGVSDEQALFRPAEGAWSVGELAHHLALTQRRIVAGIHKLLVEAERAGLGPDPDPASALGSMDFVAERAANTRFSAPPQAVPEHARPVGDTLADLRAQEAELEQLLPRLALRHCGTLKFPHPFFGDLNVYQWILFLGGHAARHSRQMAAVEQHPGWPGGGAR